MTQAGKAVIGQQEGTEGGERPGMAWTLRFYRPHAKSALNHQLPGRDGGTA